MGVVLIRNGTPCVFEAAATVLCTPLDQWIARGVEQKYVLKRLRPPHEVTSEQYKKIEAVALTFEGKPYDSTFEWSDTRIYCSELVWKIFERALHLEIGTPATLGEFDLNGSEVKELLTKRYGGKPPLKERVISPQAMFSSELLMQIYPSLHMKRS